MRATSSTTPWTWSGRDRRDRADQLAGGRVEGLEGGQGGGCCLGGRHRSIVRRVRGSRGRSRRQQQRGGSGETSPGSLILSRSGRPAVRYRRSRPLRGPEQFRLPMRRWRCGCGRGRLDELVGQEHILGEGSALRTRDRERAAAQRDPLWAARGGKTTLARIAAAGADGAFEEESAVNAGQSRDPGGDRAGSGAAAGSRAGRRSSSSTRSTASTRPSRTRCCRRSRRGC